MGCMGRDSVLAAGLRVLDPQEQDCRLASASGSPLFLANNMEFVVCLGTGCWA